MHVATHNTQATTTQHPPRLVTIRQAAQDPSVPFSENAIRNQVFKAYTRRNSRGEKIDGNGLGDTGAIIRVGRRVLLDLDLYLGWITEGGAQ